jgi:hypothetical protein
MSTTDKVTAAGDGQSVEEAALRAMLYQQPDDQKEGQRQKNLSDLGYGRNMTKPTPNKHANELHVCLARRIYNSKDTVESEDELLQILLAEGKSTEPKHKNHKLKYLLSETDTSKNILDVLVNPQTYRSDDNDDDEDDEDDGSTHSDLSDVDFDFYKLKAFICFLLRLQPKLLKDHDSDSPLALTILSPLTHCRKDTKALIISFFSANHPNFVKSLGNVVLGFSKNQNSKEQGERDVNAIHLAIEQEIDFGKDVLQKLSKEIDPVSEKSGKGKSLLFRKTGNTKKSCLHMALTAPFTKVKSNWATMLAELEPDLLMETWKLGKSDDMTPLQYFEYQRNLVLSQEKNKQSNGKQRDGNQPQNKQQRPGETRANILKADELDILADKLMYLCLTKVKKPPLDLQSFMFRNPDSELYNIPGRLPMLTSI